MSTKLLFTAALLASAAMPITAFAQDKEERADNAANDSNEIIVTAQKIEQRAVDVPITISAVSGERIKELGVSDLDELSNYVPGLNIQEQSANNPGIVIRGITSDSGSSQQGPRVTLYYNGIDISRSRGSYQAIYDLDRVEVIKGPQATLFGTASAVGAISLISARPKPGFSAEVTGGYGNFNNTLVSGFVNAGSDILAVRLAGEWRTRDGYVQNLASSQKEELYSKDQLGLRASLRFTPSSAATIDLIGTYDRQRNGGTPFISRAFATQAGPANPFGSANLGGSPYGAVPLGNDQLGLVRDVYDFNLTAAFDLGDGWSFTTVNGYRQFDSAEVFDADGGAAPFLEFAEIANGWQFSHEGRFSYNGAKWRASAGWNVFTEKGNQSVPFSTEEGTFLQCLSSLFGSPLIPGIPCVAPDGSVPAAAVTGLATGGAFTAIPYQSSFENQGKNSAYSVFADATWIVAEKLELTAGVRLLREERMSGYSSRIPSSTLSGAPLIPGQINTNGQIYKANRNFLAVLPRFNALLYVTNDVNIFATVSKGRRSPVVQLGVKSLPSGVAAPNLQIVPEETVWNYEAGIKGRAGILSGSVGVYYQKYDGFQVSVQERDANGQPTGRSTTQSAGTASNFGVEAEVQLRPADWITLFGNVGYIDGGIDKNADFASQFSGARFRLQPEWQAAAGFTINAPISDSIRFFAAPSITHRSRIFFEVPNKLDISQGPVTLINARAGFSFANEKFEVAGFIRNATGKDYLLDAGNTGGAFGIPTFIPAEPRFYGIELTARM